VFGRNLRKVLGALLLISLSSGASYAEEPLTTRQMETLSARAANGKIEKDLLSILQPIEKLNRGMFRRLHGVTLASRVFGTEFEGVCRRDEVTVWYGPTRASSEPEDAPLRPYSVEAAPFFHIGSLREAEGPSQAGEFSMWQSACERLNSKGAAGWFAARDAFHAVQGVLLLEQALRAVKGGNLKSAPCPNVLDHKKLSCEEVILAEADLAQIDSVETCPSEPETVCYVIDIASSTELTVKGRAQLDQVTPTAVLSIAVEQYVVVT